MKEEFIHFPPKTENEPFYIERAGVSYPDETYAIKRPHSHCTCVEYIIDGEGTVNCDGEVCYPKKGDIYLLPRGKDHFYFSDNLNPWAKIWININGELVQKLLSVYNPKNRVLFENADGYEYFKKIHAIAADERIPPDKKHSRAAIYFHELMQFLSDQTREEKLPREVRILKEYIDSRTMENITLKKLCDMVYLSESQVIRIFKKHLGKTPYEYMLDLKVENAKALLIGTKLMVKEIAYNLGFCDEHYFSYIFKKKTGKTPTQYRK